MFFIQNLAYACGFAEISNIEKLLVRMGRETSFYGEFNANLLILLSSNVIYARSTVDCIVVEFIFLSFYFYDSYALICDQFGVFS